MEYSKTLHQLLAYLAMPILSKNRAIGNIVEDSRAVNSEDLFIALASNNKQANNHIASAMVKNPSCIMVDSSIETASFSNNIPIIPVANLAIKLEKITNFFYENPSKKIKLIGITGTNGKTSTSWFIADILQKLASKCGILGTLGTGFINDITPTSHTTLAHTVLQRQLANWNQQAVNYATLEVSSHGLIQNRVSGLLFDTVVFTNLTRDHLDYHKTMENYAQVKSRLFSDYSYKNAIVSLDSNYSNLILNSCDKSANVLTFSLENHKADIFAKIIDITSQGFVLQLHTPWGTNKFKLPLLGKFNIENIVAAISAVGVQGYPLTAICKTIANIATVPGRMEIVNHNNLPKVIVDYAHTPDAIENLLSALKLHNYNNITCVFGCGGDRDRGKRKYMLQAVLKHTTNVIITTDNPRTESIDQIITDMLQDVTNDSKQTIHIVKDRRAAIKQAIETTNKNDLVTVVGKGHEAYQQIGTKLLKFNDLNEINSICNKLRAIKT
jgi:UDP-N-acetylmuramoyl-L-alanyl-D-glutamate--2,6-diaminopimelate ligase